MPPSAMVANPFHKDARFPLHPEEHFQQQQQVVHDGDDDDDDGDDDDGDDDGDGDGSMNDGDSDDSASLSSNYSDHDVSPNVSTMNATNTPQRLRHPLVTTLDPPSLPDNRGAHSSGSRFKKIAVIATTAPAAAKTLTKGDSIAADTFAVKTDAPSITLDATIETSPLSNVLSPAAPSLPTSGTAISSNSVNAAHDNSSVAYPFHVTDATSSPTIIDPLGSRQGTPPLDLSFAKLTLSDTISQKSGAVSVPTSKSSMPITPHTFPVVPSSTRDDAGVPTPSSSSRSLSMSSESTAISSLHVHEELPQEKAHNMFGMTIRNSKKTIRPPAPEIPSLFASSPFLTPSRSPSSQYLDVPHLDVQNDRQMLSRSFDQKMLSQSGGSVSDSYRHHSSEHSVNADHRDHTHRQQQIKLAERQRDAVESSQKINQSAPTQARPMTPPKIEDGTSGHRRNSVPRFFHSSAHRERCPDPNIQTPRIQAHHSAAVASVASSTSHSRSRQEMPLQQEIRSTHQDRRKKYSEHKQPLMFPGASSSHVQNAEKQQYTSSYQSTRSTVEKKTERLPSKPPLEAPSQSTAFSSRKPKTFVDLSNVYVGPKSAKDAVKRQRGAGFFASDIRDPADAVDSDDDASRPFVNMEGIHVGGRPLAKQVGIIGMPDPSTNGRRAGMGKKKSSLMSRHHQMLERDAKTVDTGSHVKEVVINSDNDSDDDEWIGSRILTHIKQQTANYHGPTLFRQQGQNQPQQSSSSVTDNRSDQKPATPTSRRAMIPPSVLYAKK